VRRGALHPDPNEVMIAKLTSGPRCATPMAAADRSSIAMTRSSCYRRDRW
jgi:hypothetical protein